MTFIHPSFIRKGDVIEVIRSHTTTEASRLDGPSGQYTVRTTRGNVWINPDRDAVKLIIRQPVDLSEFVPGDMIQITQANTEGTKVRFIMVRDSSGHDSWISQGDTRVTPEAFARQLADSAWEKIG